jgi:hypothetical protein
MTLTLLLFLAAPWPAQGGEQATKSVTQPGVAVPAAAGAVARQDFEVPRLQIRPEVTRPFQFLVPNAKTAPRSETQLTGPTSGVTCTLRILPVSPAKDPGILSPVKPPSQFQDPILRRDLSPCLR